MALDVFCSEFSLENEVFESNFHAGKMTTLHGKMSHTFVAAISGPLCPLFAFVCLFVRLGPVYEV